MSKSKNYKNLGKIVYSQAKLMSQIKQITEKSNITISKIYYFFFKTLYHKKLNYAST